MVQRATLLSPLARFVRQRYRQTSHGSTLRSETLQFVAKPCGVGGTVDDPILARKLRKWQSGTTIVQQVDGTKDGYAHRFGPIHHPNTATLLTREWAFPNDRSPPRHP